jgi:hypothetical protein
MVDDNKDRQLDALLDSLLSAYSAAEPRSGLEIRVRAALRARAAQRRLGWMMVFAATTAAVVLAGALTRLHWWKSTVPDGVVHYQGAPGSGADPLAGARPPSRFPKATRWTQPVGHPSGVAESNQLLVQAANAMPPADKPVFEREKLYLAPGAQPQPEVVPEPPTSTPSINIQDLVPAAQPQPEAAPEVSVSAPKINIQDLGVPSIEIKELPSVKSGNL